VIRGVPVALDGPCEPIEWTYDPWREGAARPLAAVAGGVMLAALASVSRLPAPACAAIVIGIAALLAPGFLPSHFRVDAAGISRRLAFLPWSTRTWAAVKAATLRRDGLVVQAWGGAGFLAGMLAWALPLPAPRDDGGARERLRAWRDSHGR
jgi:hypothetical protein